jgi:hypothetical protein
MMGAMFTTLKGAALWVAGGIVLAVIGAATYLTSAGDLNGSDWLAIILPILTGVIGVTSAHVAGQTAAAAFNTPSPGGPSSPVRGAVPVAAPAPGAMP